MPKKNNMPCAMKVRVLSTREAQTNEPEIKIMPATIRIVSMRVMEPV
jgi:uncharacterized DUF497 family protein